jgi:poly(A) polymerase Pap1
MGNLDNGGYAFPIPNADFQTFAPSTVEEYKRIQSGMTLRDYFAAKAMQAFITGAMSDGTPLRTMDGDDKVAAKAAYIIADAMLKERE